MARHLRLALLFIVLGIVGVRAGAGEPAVASTAGLAAAYAFDEGSGTAAADQSGNGNGATLVNATWSAAGKYGAAVQLNGTASRVNVADSPSLDLTSGLTLEAWVRPTSFASSQTLIAKERTGGGFPWGLELDNGVPSAYVAAGKNAVANGSAALPLSAWSFVAATYDGSTLRLYVNGTQVASAAVTGALATSTGPLSIGADAAWGEYTAGLIDNVRVYNRALSSAELQSDQTTSVSPPPPPPPPPAPSPAAAYALDEGSGTSTADASGHGNTMTFSGAGWTTSGKYAGAATFNGSSSIGVAPDSPSLDATSGLTIEAWVKPTAFATSQTVIAKERTGGGFPWGLELDNGIPSAYVAASANATASGTSALPTGSWSFVAATYDGSNLRLYVNGTQVASKADTGALSTSTGTLSLGADAAWGEHLNGSIDNVRVYTSALTAAQLGSDMTTAIQGSSPPPPPPDTTPPSTPTGLTTGNVSQTGATLSWSASSDNVGVTGYDLSLNGTKTTSVSTTSYTFSGLTCGTSYTFGVAAHDAAGNSSSTATAAATTAACTAPSGSSFYVDPTATGSNNGSSWANAWTSFASINWSAILPGSTLYLSGGPSGGTYTYTTALTVGASGTAGKPVTIEIDGSSAAHDGTAIFDFSADGNSSSRTGISLGSRNYVTISGNVGGSDRIRVQNIVNTSSGTSGVGVAGSGGNTGITIDHVAFVNVNNGVRITSAHGNTIENNTFTGIRGDATVALAGSTGGFDSTLVEGNTLQQLCQLSSNSCAGPDGIQSGSGVTVANNTFTEATTTTTTSTQHPDSIQNQGDYLKVYGNEFINVGDSNIDFDAFADATPHDVWIYNNVFHITTTIDPYPDFFRFYRSGGVTTTSVTNIKLWNNVFADDTNGGGIPPVNICYYSCSSPTGSGNEIKNNLFVNVGTGSASSSGAGLYIGAAGFTRSSFAISNNVFARSSGTNVVCVVGTCATGNSAITSSVDPAAAFAMPLFVHYAPGAATNDFHLQAGDTVARDTGISLSSYFTTDKDGVSRPQGGAWDRGPYER